MPKSYKQARDRLTDAYVDVLDAGLEDYDLDRHILIAANAIINALGRIMTLEREAKDREIKDGEG